MNEFEDLIQEVDIEDIPYKGFLLTWCNGRDGYHRIYSKLDRALCNNSWLSFFFSYMEVEFLAPLVSNHSPSLITIREDFNTGLKPLKSHSFWMRHQNFKGVLKENWRSFSTGSAMRKLCLQLKSL
ncbi:hypothetical protein ACH5RR_039101 [Cinchona calisaya]|uniref:Uncharacterized protein n=1 Tax=Cinchona calisaya TaxID=153742 RepID=A0ABD2XXT9_9GENT